jgi:hypothetical protein
MTRPTEIAAFKRGQRDVELGRPATNLADTPEGRAYARGVASKQNVSDHDLWRLRQEANHAFRDGEVWED